MSTEAGHTFSDSFRCVCGALVEIDHEHIRNAFTKVDAHTHRSHDCLVEPWEIHERLLCQCICELPVWRDRWRHRWDMVSWRPHRCSGRRRVVVEGPRSQEPSPLHPPAPIRRPTIITEVHDL